MTKTEASDVSLGSETAKATLAKFTMAAAGFVGTILFARLLGPVGIGGYYLLLTVVRLSNRPIGGLATAVQKRLSESGFAHGEAMTVTTAAALSWTILAGGAAFLFSDRLEAFVGFVGAPVAFVALLGVLNLFILYQGAVSASGKIARARWIDTVRSYLTLPAQLLLVWAGMGALGMVYGEAFATAVLLVPLLYYTEVPFDRPNWVTVRSLWEYAKYSIPNLYLSRIYSELDILILGVLIAESAVGHYGVAFRLSLPAMYIAMVASSGLFSRISNLLSKDEPIEEDIRNTLAFTSLFAVPMLFGGAVLGEQIVVTLYGPDFVPAASLLVGLLCYQLVRTQSSPLEKVVNGLDRPNVVTRIYVLLLGVNIVVGIALTLWFGAIGVVIATIFTELVRYVTLVFYIQQVLPDVSPIPRSLGAQFVCGLGMAAALAGLKWAIQINSWLMLSLVVGLGAGVYFLMLFVTSRVFRQTLFGTLDEMYPAWRDHAPIE